MSTQKKVAIITRHNVPNYGSFLQALATERVIEELSLCPTIIDYRRADESPEALIKHYSKQSRNVLYSIYYNTLWRYSHSYIDKTLERERERYFCCSKTVDRDSFQTVFGEYDIYLTGSDQVWNVVGSGETREIDGAYFWNDAPTGSKIISYAASFGDSKLSDDDYRRCKEWLKKFRAISVREDTGVELLREMGYNSTQVLDPTLIVDRRMWDEIVDTSTRQYTEPFALVYNLHSNSNMQSYITNDLENSNLKVYSITSTYRKVLGERVFCPTIRDFLWLYKNASCVYADSFHAIAFSIIFNTPFVVTLPKEYSTRLESILRLFGLSECISEKKKGNAWDKDRIDWSKVNKKLLTERERSRKWLVNALQSVQE